MAEEVVGAGKQINKALDMPVVDCMIDACQRLEMRSKPSDQPPAIIVRFVRCLKKEKLLWKRHVMSNLPLSSTRPFYRPGGSCSLRSRRRGIKKFFRYLWVVSFLLKYFAISYMFPPSVARRSHSNRKAHRLSLPNLVPVPIALFLITIHYPWIHESYGYNSSSCNLSHTELSLKRDLTYPATNTARNMGLCADINFLLITESNTVSPQSSPPCLSLAR
ncbi:hypothetical protein J6590_090098 [Homalodisca vitripennis]|nr:hypothetical protein J6590_090098 [Homalodisca vitripennis]